MIKMNIIVKNIFKVVGIWCICIMLYFVFSLWTHVRLHTIELIFGIKMNLTVNNGVSLTMTNNSWFWLLSLAIWILIFTMAKVFVLKGEKYERH